MNPVFARTKKDQVSRLGEERLIRRIRRWLGMATPASPKGIGDDCAVLAPAAGRELVTVDPVVAGVHFNDRVSPEEVGSKLLKRNLSDIAAMGGHPRAAVVALAMDRTVSHTWLRRFYRGLARESRRHKVPIVGGDVAFLPRSFVATLTLLGQARGRIVGRQGARVGDWIYVTGSLGGSLASGHHHRFTPRLAEGQWLAQRTEVRSMMDLSDGLAKDLAALTPPNAAAHLLDTEVPVRKGSTLRGALCDGEDYELVFCVASKTRRMALEKAWRRAFSGTRLTCIGRFVGKSLLPPGALKLEDYRGYEHLR